MRSAVEAAALATKVNGTLGSSLGGRKAVVTEAIVGNMGKLYRVELGPFAKAGETEDVCAQLKRNGLDCLTIAN